MAFRLPGIRYLPLLLLPLLPAGCATPSGSSANRAVRVSKSERQRMAGEAAAARAAFRSGDYSRAAVRLKPLCSRRTVDEPLYRCELAGALLLEGKKREARGALMAAHESIEGFFDPKLEKKAAALWGRESSKVFKGDPYERGSLYFLLSLLLLEDGDVDNALAALKTGLLADSDTEKETYKSDFGLLQLLAAKCYALRGEPELRDQMLDAAFKSFVAVPETSKRYAEELAQEYDRLRRLYEPSAPPAKTLAFVCALASERSLRDWLRKEGVPANKARSVAKWAKRATGNIDPLDFNALIVVWRGKPPSVTRVGEYGEQRVIRHGDPLSDRVWSLVVDGVDADAAAGFGDVDYQATTRGGRKMDNVLGKQATVKGALNTGGNVMLATAMQGTGSSEADAVLLVAGLAVKGIAALTHAEADIRYWHNLPHSFELLPLKLAPGTHRVELVRWIGPFPKSLRSYEWVVPSGASLSTLHVRPPPNVDSFNPVSDSPEEVRLRLFALAHPKRYDPNGDGEVSPAERAALLGTMTSRYDRDGDGKLSEEEGRRLQIECRKRFETSMTEKVP